MRHLNRAGFVVLAAWAILSPRIATANSCSVSCTYGDKCNVLCDNDAQYVVFGEIKYDGTSQGYGVCYFSIDSYHDKGTFVGWDADSTWAPAYNVWLAGGNDLARLGDTTGWEYCGKDAYDKETWVYGYLPGGNYNYNFYGEAGDDWLLLSMLDEPSSEPDSYDCISAAGTAYGGSGDDTLAGSTNSECLLGGDNDDSIYGWDGSDGLYGEAGSDHLYGDHGADGLEGGDGNDYLFGEADCDSLSGGSNSDECWCAAGLPLGGTTDGTCEGTVHYCGSCP
jgi:Ca2+-binding RTX toxin-like protein